MAAHHRVIHSENEFANPLTGAHANTAEAVISQVQRALVGVYHNLGGQHLQRYLDEIVWRWNHRDPAREVVKQWTTKKGCCTREIYDDLEADPGARPDAGAPSGGCRKADAAFKGIWTMLAVMISFLRWITGIAYVPAPSELYA